MAVCLALIAVWILISGLDDLFIDFVFFARRKKPFPWPAEAELAQTQQRRIAVLIALWREHSVIEEMLRHNLSALLYGNYDIFVGVYPNDPLTKDAVERVARDDARVHVAVGPHDGPTSKGDCLNSAYQWMVEYEIRRGIDFEILMTHDAEDLMHPDSLRLINWFSRDYQMVQIPVLPLPTRLREWTHGLYCDEFAEFQLKDITVRRQLGGFLPSNGVGTGFDRSALEALRRRHQGRIFDPECLTEDYENGFRMHAAGYRQIFVPIRLRDGEPAATREYFPRNWRAAIRQRSRWVAGITLQGWQYHGWRVPLLQAYWFWRDRKGLVGNLLSPVANLLLLYWMAACGLTLTGLAGIGLAYPLRHAPVWLQPVFAVSAAISVIGTGVRVYLSARIYGMRFAAFAPLRAFWGNLINCCATSQALYQFVTARIRRRSLAWRKTDHVYPGVPARGIPLRMRQRPRLGEVLVHLRMISTEDLEHALLHKPKGQRIGEYLVRLNHITVIDLDQALSSQAGTVGVWVPELLPDIRDLPKVQDSPSPTVPA